MNERRTCPDGGICHHGCQRRGHCWRRDEGGCVPLACSGLANDWKPLKEMEAKVMDAAKRLEADPSRFGKYWCAFNIQDVLFPEIKEFKAKELGISKAIQKLKQRGLIEKVCAMTYQITE